MKNYNQLRSVVHREIGFVKDAQDNLDTARSNLILAVRKLRLDKSILAESLRK